VSVEPARCRWTAISLPGKSIRTPLSSAAWFRKATRLLFRIAKWVLSPLDAGRRFGSSASGGFRSIRVHDLKHTYGHRPRAAGVGFEDRKILLGHKSDHVTTHYSAPEIGALVEASERVCELKSRKSPALAIVRVLRNEAQVSDVLSGT
jgi:hypothetical protein